MANIKSQIKRNRQNEGRRLRNKSVRSSLKTSSKKVLGGTGNGEDSETALREALRELDRAQSKGILHKRSAARRKSRLTRAAGSAPVAE